MLMICFPFWIEFYTKNSTVLMDHPYVVTIRVCLKTGAPNAEIIHIQMENATAPFVVVGTKERMISSNLSLRV